MDACEPTLRDSPSRSQDVLTMGTALDAAHTHGVSVASEHRCARCPGVPALQEAIVSTCVETEMPTDKGSSHFSRESIYTCDDFPEVLGCPTKSPVLELSSD